MSPPSPSDPRARRAVQIVFFIAGVGLSAWAPMVPYAKDRLQLDEGTLGVVLLALGIGGVLAMPLTGVACRVFGVRRVILASVGFVPLGLPLLSWTSATWTLALALFGFGFSIGVLDVAMNTASVDVERASGRALLSSIHALYSIGSLTGAGAMALLLRCGVSLLTTTLLVTCALLALALVAASGVPDSAPEPKADGPRRLPWHVIGIGLLCFVAFVTEGSMLDWTAVYLHIARDVPEASAGFGYVAFAVAMVAARLLGDRVIARVGSVRVVRGGALLAAFGLVLAALVPSAWVAGLGFALVGFGAGNIVPSLFGAAGRAPELPAAHSLAIVSSLGYVGSIAGPAAIGGVAAKSSLGAALCVVAAGLVVVAIASGALTRPAPNAE